jgi:hypothetical protein
MKLLVSKPSVNDNLMQMSFRLKAEMALKLNEILS